MRKPLAPEPFAELQYNNGMDTPSPNAAAISAFAALSNPEARWLILGSMPGVASLQAQQYYAHPRNAFWHIMQDLFGTAPAPETYKQKIALLRTAKVALWDVLAQCKRPGSLDANIDRNTVVCNDFNSFLAKHRKLEKIAFNGKAAEQLFNKHVVPDIELPAGTTLVSLPSSSPAMASLNMQQKACAWRSALFT